MPQHGNKDVGEKEEEEDGVPSGTRFEQARGCVAVVAVVGARFVLVDGKRVIVFTVAMLFSFVRLIFLLRPRGGGRVILGSFTRAFFLLGFWTRFRFG